MPDIKFGRYEIKREIGRGGMATVYHAFDPLFGRDVAIKVLPREFLHDPQFRVRFEREAKTIATLEHAAIVPVHDFGEQEGQPYIVMRFMSGGSLADRLQKGPLPLNEVVRILSRLGPALDAAHQKGIIHRDLKPGNILFDQYDDAYIADFGIARLQQAGVATITGSAIVGTPAYMSPEQIQGDKQIDGRSDIYALGVILFQMLTGQMPYQADTPAKLLVMHLMEPVPQVRAANLIAGERLPPAFDTVIEQAMAKDRTQRYATAGQMAQMVEAAASGGNAPRPPSPPASTASTRAAPAAPGRASAPPVRPPPPGRARPAGPYPAGPPPAQGRTPPGRGLLPWIVGGAGLAMLCLAVVGVIIVLVTMNQNQPVTAESQPTRTRRPTATADRIAIAPAEPTAALEPTQAPVAVATEAPTADPDMAYTQAAQTVEARFTQIAAQYTPTPLPSPTSVATNTPPPTATLAPTEAPTSYPRLAYLKGPVNASDLYVINYDGSGVLAVAKQSCDEADPSWSPDGYQIVYNADCNGSYDLWVVNSSGGGDYALTSNSSTDEREPDWSPDGALIAYRQNPLNEGRASVGDLRVLNLRTFEDYSLGIQGRAPAWSHDGRWLAYMSDESGRWQIYTYDLQSGAIKKLTSCSVNCRWPEWSPDDTLLVYNTTTAAASTDPDGIWSISASGGSSNVILEGGPYGRPSWSDTGWIAFNNSNGGIDVVEPDSRDWYNFIPDGDAWAPMWEH